MKINDIILKPLKDFSVFFGDIQCLILLCPSCLRGNLLLFFLVNSEICGCHFQNPS